MLILNIFQDNCHVPEYLIKDAFDIYSYSCYHIWMMKFSCQNRIWFILRCVMTIFHLSYLSFTFIDGNQWRKYCCTNCESLLNAPFRVDYHYTHHPFRYVTYGIRFDHILYQMNFNFVQYRLCVTFRKCILKWKCT